MKKILLFILSLFLLLPPVNAEGDGKKEKKEKSKADSIKTGWTFGGVPVVAYDRDVGFKYGALVNFYNFGDGSRYPMYDHSIYLEYSRTTKGSSISQLSYDSDRLIPGIRTALEASYYTEQGLDFYGFNGYQAKYKHAFEMDDDTTYISRMFYRQDRKLIRIRADFSGDLYKENLKWFAGIEFNNNKINAVNLDKLNKGKDDEDLLPDVDGGLYFKYVEWGIIPEREQFGGTHTLLKAGVIFDTRDNEPNPMKGIWTDAILVLAPGFLSDKKDMTYAKLTVTHRQYFTIIPKNLNFAYRLSYQGKLFGEMPSYMLPFIYNSPPNYTRDGLGGAKTVRGILRNRVVGEGYLYGNTELRWKFIHTKLFKQNFHIALSAFFDAGMVVQEYKMNTSDVPDDFLINGKTYYKSDFFPTGKDKPHFGTGGGIRFVLNENFIVAFDYGVALKSKDDGKGAPYINLNWLF